MKGTHWLLAACIAATTLAHVDAQVVEQVSAPELLATPQQGNLAGNRYTGFVPKHEKILMDRGIAPSSSPPTTRTELESRPPTPKRLPRTESNDTGIQQASYDVVVGDGITSPCGCENPCNGMMCKLPKLYGRAEYMYMWSNGVDLPSLVTTSPSGTIQDDAGVLPNATTLFGSDTFHDGMPGGRITAGMWLNPEMRSAVEFSFMFLEDDESFRGTQDGFEILARPFFNVDLDEEDSRLIVFDGLVEGSLNVRAATEFESFEILLRRAFSVQAGARTDLLFGFRRAKLDDVIRFDEQTTSLSGPTIDSQFNLFDEFSTENEFVGGVIGLDYVGPAIRCWSLGLNAKVAIGYSESDVNIAGQTAITTDPGLPTENTVTNSGGLLTQESNIGSFGNEDFSTLSEVGISMTRQWPCGLGLRVGYNFLLWHEVARAGNAIDRFVNPTQIAPSTLVGEARPAQRDRRDNFWAQGITAGIEYRF